MLHFVQFDDENLTVHSHVDEVNSNGPSFQTFETTELIDVLNTPSNHVKSVSVSLETLRAITIEELKLIFDSLFTKMQTFTFKFENGQCTAITINMSSQPTFPACLDWSNQNLIQVPPDILIKLLKAVGLQITQLNFRGCNLSQFPLRHADSFFKAIPRHILAIDLAYNALFNLKALIVPLVGLLPDTLYYLDLSYNLIGIIPFNTLQLMGRTLPSKLQQLNMMGNKLANLHGRELVPFLKALHEKVLTIFLRDNQFDSLPSAYAYFLWIQVIRANSSLDIEPWFFTSVLQGHIHALNSSEQTELFTPMDDSPFLLNNALLLLILRYLQLFNSELAYLTIGFLLNGEVRLTEAPTESWVNALESRLHEVVRLYTLAACASQYRDRVNLLLWMMKIDSSLPPSVITRLASIPVPPPCENWQQRFPQLKGQPTMGFFTPLVSGLKRFASPSPQDKDDEPIHFNWWLKQRPKLALLNETSKTTSKTLKV